MQPRDSRSIGTTFVVAVGAFVLGLGAARVPAVFGADAEQFVRPTAGRIIVQNTYFPKPGMEDEVLATRLEASAVRARAGLVEGRVLLHVEGPDDAPYVMWEAEYEDAAARQADVDALDGTDFSRVSSHMGTLLDHFGRTVWEVVQDDE